MNRQDILRMARDAGLAISYDERDEDGWQELERFAALVAADENEECAKICDEEALVFGVTDDVCASRIRARGNA